MISLIITFNKGTIIVNDENDFGPIINEISHVICEGYRACYEKSIECVDDIDCNIECNGEEACYDTPIQCPKNANCNIYCYGKKSCYGTIVNSTQSKKLFVTTLNKTHSEKDVLDVNYDYEQDNIEYQIYDTIIYCPKCGDCHIDCIGKYSCYEPDINAENSKNLYIRGAGYESFYHTYVYCPNGGNCYITCDATFQNGESDTCSSGGIYGQKSKLVEINIKEGNNSRYVFGNDINCPDIGDCNINIHSYEYNNDNEQSALMSSRIKVNGETNDRSLNIYCNATDKENRCINSNGRNNFYCNPTDRLGTCELKFNNQLQKFICDDTQNLDVCNDVFIKQESQSYKNNDLELICNSPTSSPIESPTRILQPTNLINNQCKPKCNCKCST